VLDGSFLGRSTAIMVPRTSDGRVMFAIPWHGHALIGTTDTPIKSIDLEPTALNEEIDFILETASRYLAKPPTRADVKSVFTGIRPLVKAGGDAGSTAALSRDHTISISKSGLLTIAGGKWTTYRKMAEDAVDHAATLGELEDRECATKTLAIHGRYEKPEEFGELGYYGSDAPAIRELMRAEPRLAEPIHAGLTLYPAQVVWAARYEMARTVDDVLARRTRALYLNAQAAIEAAPAVAALLAAELGRDAAWESGQVSEFTSIAQHYLIPK
jgi:glycerol-3-phosphate dehydrogenase